MRFPIFIINLHILLHRAILTNLIYSVNRVTSDVLIHKLRNLIDPEIVKSNYIDVTQHKSTVSLFLELQVRRRFCPCIV